MDDISGILERWPFDPSRIQARRLEGSGPGARPIVQLRVDMGVLQMYRDGRPDGTRPGGHQSLLHQYRALAERAARRGVPPEALRIPPEDFPELDRELLQYHHRSLAFFALGDHARAARDANHGLELLMLIKRCAKDGSYVARHERTIPLVIFERARARALTALDGHKPALAVRHMEEGMRLLREHIKGSRCEAGAEAPRQLAFLGRWARRVRIAHGLGPPLETQLDEAVRREDYEEAARLRDEIRRRSYPSRDA